MATIQKPTQSSIIGLSAEQIQSLRERAARKMGVPIDHIAGPFSDSDKPVQQSGLYLRVSPRSGSLMWAHYDVLNRFWGLYSNKQPSGGINRALARRTRRSKKAALWFGVSSDVSHGKVKLLSN